MIPRLAFSVIGLVAVSAAPPPAADVLQRDADAAVARGDWAAADQLYSIAAERSADPGLVAFNLGTVLFAKGEFRDAELHFVRCLDDASIPSERRARALYNRGACLLKRGGASAVYRTAILCFEGCLDAGLTDATLTADAKHNLELAKLLWAQARLKDTTPDRPNDPPPEEKPDRPPPKPDTGPMETGPDAAAGQEGVGQAPRVVPQPGPAEGGASPTDQKTAGSGTLPVLTDADGVQKLTPEDTQAYLARIAARLAKDQRDTARLVAGPDRKTVRDW